MKKSLLTISLFCFGSALTVALLSLIFPLLVQDNEVWVIYIFILLTMILLLNIEGRWARGLNIAGISWLLHPPILITAWALLTMGIPGLVSFFYPDTVDSIKHLVGVDYIYLVWGMGLVLAGLLCLWISYVAFFCIIRPLNVLKKLSTIQLSQLVVLQFYGLTILFRIIRIGVTGIAFGADNSRWGPLQGFNQWIAYVEGGRFLVIAIVSCYAFSGKWPHKWLIFITFIELAFAFTSGFMKPLLWIAIVIMLSALYSGVDFRRYSLYAISLIIAGILIVPISQGIRSEMGHFNNRSFSGLLQVTQLSFQSIWGEGLGSGWGIFVDKILGRQAVTAYMPGIIMRQTPSLIPYEGFQQFLSIPAYIVPRSLWLDKPILSRGVWFSVSYLNMPSNTISSSTMTMFGEGYVFAGWIGVILAMSILGFILALVFQNTVLNRLIPLYIAFAPTFIDIESQFTIMAVALVQKFLVFLFIYYLLAKFSERVDHRKLRDHGHGKVPSFLNARTKNYRHERF